MVMIILLPARGGTKSLHRFKPVPHSNSKRPHFFLISFRYQHFIHTYYNAEKKSLNIVLILYREIYKCKFNKLIKVPT